MPSQPVKNGQGADNLLGRGCEHVHPRPAQPADPPHNGGAVLLGVLQQTFHSVQPDGRPASGSQAGENVAFLHAGGGRRVRLQPGIPAGSTDGCNPVVPPGRSGSESLRRAFGGTIRGEAYVAGGRYGRIIRVLDWCPGKLLISGTRRSWTLRVGFARAVVGSGALLVLVGRGDPDAPGGAGFQFDVIG